MSVEVLLVPLGLAAYSALKEARSSDLCEKCKATRISSGDLLQKAIEVVGARITQASEDRVLASSRWGSLTFQRIGDIFLGRVDGAAEEVTYEMLSELDAAAGRLMQVRTAQLAVSRAQSLGFRLIEQREENGALNFVFEESQ